jgi:hypothetical protein
MLALSRLQFFRLQFVRLQFTRLQFVQLQFVRLQFVRIGAIGTLVQICRMAILDKTFRPKTKQKISTNKGHFESALLNGLVHKNRLFVASPIRGE